MGENPQGRKHLKGRRGNAWGILSMVVIAKKLRMNGR
jgi:hypothetical protein